MGEQLGARAVSGRARRAVAGFEALADVVPRHFWPYFRYCHPRGESLAQPALVLVAVRCSDRIAPAPLPDRPGHGCPAHVRSPRAFLPPARRGFCGAALRRLAGSLRHDACASAWRRRPAAQAAALQVDLAPGDSRTARDLRGAGVPRRSACQRSLLRPTRSLRPRWLDRPAARAGLRCARRAVPSRRALDHCCGCRTGSTQSSNANSQSLAQSSSLRNRKAGCPGLQPGRPRTASPPRLAQGRNHACAWFQLVPKA